MVSLQIKDQLQQELTKTTYIAFDLETTGGNPSNNGITEIYGIKYCDGKILETFHQLVNPQRLIPHIVRKITGITNKTVKDSPPIKEVMPRFLDFIGDAILVSHNVLSDWAFLEYYAKKICNKKIKNLYFCTHLLGKKLFPLSPKKSLGGFAEFLDLHHGVLHRAQEDAECTLKLWLKIQEKLLELRILNIEQIIRYQAEYILLARIGWGINNNELHKLCNKPGILRFFNVTGHELYISSTHNLRHSALRLKRTKNLSKYLHNILLQAQSFNYEVYPDFYSALIDEAKIRANKYKKAKDKGEIGCFNCISIKKNESELEIKLGAVLPGSYLNIGPIKDYKSYNNFLKLFAKNIQGKYKKNTYFLPLACEELLVSYLSNKMFKSFWINLKLNNPQRLLTEKIKFFYNLPKPQGLKKLFISYDHYGIICSQQTDKSWAFYPIKDGLPSEPIHSQTKWSIWKKSITGAQTIEAIKKQKETKSTHLDLTKEQAALMSASLWFIHEKKAPKNYSLGEYIPL
jgi:DNA polymerase III epsilon subunit family exonuclease